MTEQVQLPRPRPHFGRLRLAAHGVLILVIVAAILPGPLEALFADYGADVDREVSDRALGHYAYLKDHFEAPFVRYGATDVFVPQFAAVFLSHAAIGFANVGMSDPSRRAESAASSTRSLAEPCRGRCLPMGPTRRP